MNSDVTPSQHDYVRLQRAVFGGLSLSLAMTIVGFAIEFASFEAGVVEALFCLLYCSLLIVGIFAWSRRPLTPQTDPTHERFARLSMIGRRLCFLLGIAGPAAASILAFLLTDEEFWPHCALLCEWALGFGVLFLFWSFQFPRQR